jgi:hypothetical protein
VPIKVSSIRVSQNFARAASPNAVGEAIAQEVAVVRHNLDLSVSAAILGRGLALHVKALVAIRLEGGVRVQDGDDRDGRVVETLGDVHAVARRMKHRTGL